jgi:hypothetical protein
MTMPSRGFGAALHEATEWLTSPKGLRLERLSRESLAQRIESLAMQVRGHELAGDTEKAHETAVELAGCTLFYMARGLS